MNFLNG